MKDKPVYLAEYTDAELSDAERQASSNCRGAMSLQARGQFLVYAAGAFSLLLLPLSPDGSQMLAVRAAYVLCLLIGVIGVITVAVGIARGYSARERRDALVRAQERRAATRKLRGEV